MIPLVKPKNSVLAPAQDNASLSQDGRLRAAFRDEEYAGLPVFHLSSLGGSARDRNMASGCRAVAAGQLFTHHGSVDRRLDRRHMERCRLLHSFPAEFRGRNDCA